MGVARRTPVRRYVIGDVHGCATTLENLLDVVAPRDEDELWFVGDFVQRGAGSADVVRRVRDLEETARIGAVRTVIGNHDLHLIAVARGLRPESSTDAHDLLRAPDAAELVDWLVRRPFLCGDDDVLLVHAGIDPRWSRDDAQRHARDAESLLRGESTRDAFLEAVDPRTSPARPHEAGTSMTRLRFCAADGTPEPSLKGTKDSSPDPERIRPWFEWDAPWKSETRVVFGHWAALGVHTHGGATGLDSGCAWGRTLTAFELSSGVVTQVPRDARDAV